MVVVLVQPNPKLRRTHVDVLTGAGYLTVGAGSFDDALRSVRDASPGVIVVDASREATAAERFVRRVRADARTATIPIVGIAYVLGTENGLLEAGAQCCLRRFPTAQDLLKAVRWADDVYCHDEAAAADRANAS